MGLAVGEAGVEVVIPGRLMGALGALVEYPVVEVEVAARSKVLELEVMAVAALVPEVRYVFGGGSSN